MTFDMAEFDQLFDLMTDEEFLPDKGDLVLGDVSWRTVRRLMDLKSEKSEEWQGIPVPLPDMEMRLCKGHPFEARQRAEDRAKRKREIEESDGARIVNSWYCARRSMQVVIAHHPDGRVENASYHVSPDRSMERLNLWLGTLGASDGWDHDAERKARHKLKGMLTPRAYRHYDLTGTFMETSPRSHLTYLFRRLRPTIVLSPRNRHGIDSMYCIAVLCLHPIGYYEGSWGGCMVPTDDVIAHLTMMRGDEAHFWGKANHHKARNAEAGV